MSVGGLIMYAQRRSEKLAAPLCSERVECRLIREPVSHHACESCEEGLGIEGRRHQDVLAGGSVRHIDEAMGCAAGNTYDIAHVGEKASPFDGIEVTTLDDTKDLRFP